MVALFHGGPVAVPDVPAYLSVPQWVVGVGQSPAGLQFHPGYGLLLVPAAAVVQADGQALHTLALMLNALAAGAVVVVAVRLAQRCFGRPELAASDRAEPTLLAVRATPALSAVRAAPTLLAVALLAALHPSLTSAARIAWPETLLVLLTLSIGLCLANASQKLSHLPLGVAGLLAGLSFSLHPRALVLTLALCVVVVVLRWVRAAWRRVVIGLGVGWALSIGAIAITGTWPSQRAGAAATLENGAEPAATAAGQLVALAAGTIGLALVGLVFGSLLLARTAKQTVTRTAAPPAAALAAAGLAAAGPPTEQAAGWADPPAADSPATTPLNTDPLTAVAIFFAAGALCAIALGGWVLAGSTRVDTLLYGRYIDPWAVPLSIVAICALLAPRTRQFSKTVLWNYSLFSLAAALALVLLAVPTGDATPARRIMTLSLSPIWSLVGQASLRNAALLATLLAAVGVALLLVASKVARACLVALALALFGAAAVSNGDHLAEVGDISQGQAETADLAVELAAELAAQNTGQAAGQDTGQNEIGSCLAHSADDLPSYVRWLYRLRAPELRHEFVSFSAGQKACGPLVIARTTIQQTCPNALLQKMESRGAWGLWQLPASSSCLAAVR